MAKQNQQALPADLAKARDRLTAWRQTKEPSSRIPEALWKRAVELAAKYGVHRTARTLRIDYYSLKKRSPRGGGIASREGIGICRIAVRSRNLVARFPNA